MATDDVTEGSDQSGGTFRGVDFGESRSLRRVNFRGADLSRTSFSRGFLGDGEVHTKHHLEQMCYPSMLAHCDFTGADLTEANFYACNLESVSLNEVTAVRADFRRACIRYASGEGANLSGAHLSGATFESSSFETARFVGVVCGATVIGQPSKYVGEAWLIPASFRRALLIGADFSNADLRGVDFTGADLTGAKFDGALLDGAIIPD
jgi:uncharacterized protein YjbI with pentapeptide repeats